MPADAAEKFGIFFKRDGIGSNCEDFNLFLEEFLTNPSIKVVDQFCLYYVKNNLGDYKTSLRRLSVENVANDIRLDMEFVYIYIGLGSQYLSNRNMTSAYESYREGMNCLLDIMDTLEKYPEYKERFLSGDIAEARKTIEESISLMRNAADDYVKKDSSELEVSSAKFLEAIDRIIVIVEEIKTNCGTY